MLFVLLHTVTWFGLAPKAIVVRMRGRRVPPRVIVVAHYLLWLLLSVFIAWVILR
jgi:fumarate reductase subunit C